MGGLSAVTLGNHLEPKWDSFSIAFGAKAPMSGIPVLHLPGNRWGATGLYLSNFHFEIFHSVESARFVSLQYRTCPGGIYCAYVAK